MLVWVTEASAIGDWSLRVRFNTGETFDVNLEDKLSGPVFEPLTDPAVFRQLKVDPDTETVVWPNGADLAPEFLYELALDQRRDSA